MRIRTRASALQALVPLRHPRRHRHPCHGRRTHDQSCWSCRQPRNPRAWPCHRTPARTCRTSHELAHGSNTAGTAPSARSGHTRADPTWVKVGADAPSVHSEPPGPLLGTPAASSGARMRTCGHTALRSAARAAGAKRACDFVPLSLRLREPHMAARLAARPGAFD